LDPKNRILVAGGAGFIGRHLCSRLVELGHEIDVIDNFCTSDTRGRTVLQELGVHVIEADVTMAPDRIYDAIFHLASPASPVHYRRLSIQTMWANALGARRLLDLSVSVGARFLLASTSEIYGDPLQHPQTEAYWGNVNPVGERACYDESKRFAEALTSEYRRVYRANARIARIFNTYGPGMALWDGRAIPEFIVAALRGEPIKIQGAGSQTRSFCFVSDLVEGLIAMGLDPAADGHIYNVGNPGEVSILQIAEAIRDHVGSSSELIFVPGAPDDPKRRCPDISKIQAAYSWTPRVGLAEGLRATIDDIASRLHDGAGRSV